VIAWNSSPVPTLPGHQSGVGLYDTAQGRTVELAPEDSPSLYVCGITPYDATHLGHAATYVAFDLLNRTWRDTGAAVRYVQNVTDVDDPLLERAAATGVDWQELARTQIDLFRTDMEALNVLAPDHYIGAVESIDWIVPVVESLLNDGLAYLVPGVDGGPDGDVYFSVEAASALGAEDPSRWALGLVSHLPEEEMIGLFAERGGDPQRPGKKHPLDPLLWRVAREGEPRWAGGLLGEGRPGWHIECSVIARRYLPAPLTVQGGGSDLMFPHHEMSAGHTWASGGTPLARHYAHSGMVGLDGEKMSKSKGNLVLVSTLRREGVDPAAIRLAILAHHYRTDWSWSGTVLTEATARLAAWRTALPLATEDAASGLRTELRAALADDLNAPAALRAVDRWAEKASAEGRLGTAEGSAEVAAALDALLGVRL
jgi:L-cysteine:1D-myo-inositol 2-amino-2-deoxy-alpha-D-glucopyranoside ligase